jgi:hypothetical protein
MGNKLAELFTKWQNNGMGSHDTSKSAGKSANKGRRIVKILGTRGIPASHGGFETFVGQLAPFLQKNDWAVSVYCQHDRKSSEHDFWEDDWQGIQRINISTKTNGPLSTIEFDIRAIVDSLRRPGINLVLGYNTAVFSILQKIYGQTVVMNMDGIEWRRAKWGSVAKAWFWLNEMKNCLRKERSVLLSISCF